MRAHLKLRRDWRLRLRLLWDRQMRRDVCAYLAVVEARMEETLPPSEVQRMTEELVCYGRTQIFIPTPPG